MKIVRGVTLHPQSSFKVKSLITFQICYPHKIEIASTKRGALHSLEIAYEIFSEQKDLHGFLMDFS